MAPARGGGNASSPGADVGNSGYLEELQLGSEKGGEKKLEWKKAWYPVSLLEDLDPTLPTAVQLLGRPLVLWRDGASASWRAFLDQCPHRLAPLSEGRIDESGWLQCSYHGWSFDGSGGCQVIPQAAAQGPEARARFSPRACAVAFPVKESQGLLFVWPDEAGWEEALQTAPPQLPPEFEDPGFRGVNIQRDLPYSYDILMENVADPSHIEFAHHKVTGRRERARPLAIQLNAFGLQGFRGATREDTTTPSASSDPPDGQPSKKPAAQFVSEFIAPAFFVNKVVLTPPFKIPFAADPEKWIIYIASFNVPMAHGKSRSIVLSARNFFQFTVPGPAWWQWVPRWLEHCASNKVFDGDMIVLAGQEALLREKEEDYSKLVFTPTAADRLVLAFRNWLKRYGGGGPTFPDSCAPSAPTMGTKREMLDRFSQHTQICSACRGALKNLRIARHVLLGVAFLLLAGGVVLQAANARVAVAAASVLCAAGAAAIRAGPEQDLLYRDYTHAKID